ncbi:MAG TPA: YeeE/YedE family protein, partial [Nitrospiria bacterium]|nr:YeeE/YedE family protein [Nitrospiria bacterium]
DLTLFRAYILAVIIQMTLINILYQLGWIEVSRAPFFWMANIIGGFIFGIGMVLAGGCTSAIWYRSGEGMLGSAVAVIGLFAGIYLSGSSILRSIIKAFQADVISVGTEEATLYNLLGANPWLIIGIITLVAGVWILRSPSRGYQGGWNWKLTGIAIGIIGALAWIASWETGRKYGLGAIEGSKAISLSLIRGELSKINWAAFMLIGIPIGSFISARNFGEFMWRSPGPKRIAQAFSGGLIMGIGGVMAGGCTIGHGITGVSLLAMGSIVSLIFIVLGGWTMTYILFGSS